MYEIKYPVNNVFVETEAELFDKRHKSYQRTYRAKCFKPRFSKGISTYLWLCSVSDAPVFQAWDL